MNTKISFILFLFYTVICNAQISLYANTDSKEVSLNGEVTLTVILEIEGNQYEQESPIKLPDLSKFEMIGDGSTRNIIVDPTKNVKINQIIYQALLSPKQTGKTKIGSVLVKISGKMYKTEPFYISVSSSTAKNQNYGDSDLTLKLQLAKDLTYEHQPVLAVLKAYSKNIDNFRKIKKINLPHNAQFYFCKVNSGNGDIEQVDYNQTASTVLGTYLIYPNQSGLLSIPKISVDLPAEERQSYKKLFSDNISLNVKPLPKENFQQKISNAAGTFQLHLEKLGKVTSIKDNKPITIRLTLSGEGNLSEIKLPEIIADKENFKAYPSKTTKNFTVDNNGLKGKISKDFVIIPNENKTLKIALKPFYFFNIKKWAYDSLSVPPISIGDTTKQLSKSTTEQITRFINQNNKDITKNPPKLKDNPPFINLWYIVILSFSALGVILFFFFKKRRKTNKTSPSLKAKNSDVEKINLDPYYNRMREALNQKDTNAFFSEYSAMLSHIEQSAKPRYKSVKDYLYQEFGNNTAEDFEKINYKIKFEKYAPHHDEDILNGLYFDIINIFSNLNRVDIKNIEQ
ncbi:BatD family protein [Riemerella columbipharyngis]|uniref:Oxygen tolerance n=1 Tax=Riemerella columbipharyngis TaxID=1071918 RepID=A0A1G6Y4B4_9FLAO|nr:BatD family protein [Riemerella columbipharyngis]SDD84446.1 Oxygen tolerance [Riemerella columbipharyngis]